MSPRAASPKLEEGEPVQKRALEGCSQMTEMRLRSERDCGVWGCFALCLLVRWLYGLCCAYIVLVLVLVCVCVCVCVRGWDLLWMPPPPLRPKECAGEATAEAIGPAIPAGLAVCSSHCLGCAGYAIPARRKRF